MKNYAPPDRTLFPAASASSTDTRLLTHSLLVCSAYILGTRKPTGGFQNLPLCLFSMVFTPNWVRVFIIKQASVICNYSLVYNP